MIMFKHKKYYLNYLIIQSKLIIFKYLISSSQTAIRKTDVNGTLIWMAGLTGYPLYKSLSVDVSEQSVYLWRAISPIETIRLDAPTGSIISAYSM